jgi:hypothetical protein
MKKIEWRPAVVWFIGAALAAAAAPAAEAPAGNLYASYAFLIGEWDVVPEVGGSPAARSLFRWGPNQSYIWFATSLLEGGKETPHFEGMLVWNGARKDLDMLLALDLDGGGHTQERGTVSLRADGTVVREIVATSTDAGGKASTARFRQTFTPAGPDRILTSVLRESGQRFVATFPGSDRLVMARRKGAGA